MKIKYLVRSADEDRLIQVSGKEWYEITEESNRLPKEQQRYFIRDVIEDRGDMDVLVLEVSKEEYGKWKIYTQWVRRHCVPDKDTPILSLEAPVSELRNIPIIDTLPADNSAEEEYFRAHLLEDLQASLDEWKPWARELLRLYMNGERQSSTTKWLANTCGVSEQTARRYKQAFKQRVKEFFSE